LRNGENIRTLNIHKNEWDKFEKINGKLVRKKIYKAKIIGDMNGPKVRPEWKNLADKQVDQIGKRKNKYCRCNGQEKSIIVHYNYYFEGEDWNGNQTQDYEYLWYMACEGRQAHHRSSSSCYSCLFANGYKEAGFDIYDNNTRSLIKGFRSQRTKKNRRDEWQEKNEVSEVEKAGEKTIASKVFDNSDFGYYKVVVENDLFGKRKDNVYSELRFFSEDIIRPLEKTYKNDFSKFVYGELPDFEKVKEDLEVVIDSIRIWEKEVRFK